MAMDERSRKKGLEIVKKGRYRVYNGADYELIHLETTADQVIESESKKFVSQTEKNTWNAKADGNHNHDSVYAKLDETYNKETVDSKLEGKANATHGHSATDISTDSSHRFVTDAEKTRWNNTYTKGEVDGFISNVNDSISSKEQANASEHAKIRKEFAAADKLISDKVGTVENSLHESVESLTNLINQGGTANQELTKRVEKIENTDIPTIKSSVSALDGKLSPKIANLEQTKADKTAVTEEISTAKRELIASINTKAEKAYVDENLDLKADKKTTYTKEEVNAELSTKVNNDTFNTKLGEKVDKSTYTSEMALKADQSTVNAALETKAATSYVNAELNKKANAKHTHELADINGLGTVASKNVGTTAGQVPILDEKGKLPESILPSIAINEVFTAENITEAMKLDMQVGDVLILSDLSTLTYTTKNGKQQKVSEEYIKHVNSGKMTFLCVKTGTEIFEEKFKPLQSTGDSISRGEVEEALGKKVDKVSYEADKAAINEKIDSKANANNVHTKEQINSLLNNKVDKIPGKQLSTNDFNNEYKQKLEGIQAGANNYQHPTGDGNLHVPATGTSNNGKVLMAGASAGAMTWTPLNSDHIATTSSKRFVTDEQIKSWTAKAEAVHTHEQYRLISDSLSTSQTKAEINKFKTIVSESAPEHGTQAPGAVWIEEIV